MYTYIYIYIYIYIYLYIYLYIYIYIRESADFVDEKGIGSSTEEIEDFTAEESCDKEDDVCSEGYIVLNNYLCKFDLVCL